MHTQSTEHSVRRHSQNLARIKRRRFDERYLLINTESGKGDYLSWRRFSWVIFGVFLYLVFATALAIMFARFYWNSEDTSAQLRGQIDFLSHALESLQEVNNKQQTSLEMAQLALRENRNINEQYKEELSKYVVLNESFLLKGADNRRFTENGEEGVRGMERELAFARSQLQRLAERVYAIEGELRLDHQLSIRKARDLTVDDIYQAIDNLDDEVTLRKQIIADIPLSWPAEGRVTSDYGVRIHPVTKQASFHNAYDIANVVGTPVRTTANGVVVGKGYNPIAGNFLEIEHSFGFMTRYAHLREIFVEIGDQVSRFDTVGSMGATGRTTGSHLHYEVLYQGSHTNPSRFLQGNLANVHRFFSYPEVKWRYSQLKKKLSETSLPQ